MGTYGILLTNPVLEYYDCIKGQSVKDLWQQVLMIFMTMNETAKTL